MSKIQISNKKFINNSIIFGFILLLLDILTKYFFTSKSYFENSLIYIQYSQNYGSALSMFSNFNYYNYFIIILSFIVIYFLYKNIKEFKEYTLTRISFYLLIPGIVGNLFDRLLFGYVRDFIGLKFLFIFNIADVYLTLAVIFFIYHESILLSFISKK